MNIENNEERDNWYFHQDQEELKTHYQFNEKLDGKKVHLTANDNDLSHGQVSFGLEFFEILNAYQNYHIIFESIIHFSVPSTNTNSNLEIKNCTFNNKVLIQNPEFQKLNISDTTFEKKVHLFGYKSTNTKLTSIEINNTTFNRGFAIKDIDCKTFILNDSRFNTKLHQGVGMNLATCKMLIEELYGGEIWVENTKGKGSRFCFTIGMSK